MVVRFNFALGATCRACAVNRLHQMGFAETDSPINEQRVIRARRRLRDRKTRGMRNFVVRADHERFEGVPWIESGHSCAWLRVAWWFL